MRKIKDLKRMERIRRIPTRFSLHAYVSGRSGFVKHFTVSAQSAGYRRIAKAAPGEWGGIGFAPLIYGSCPCSKVSTGSAP
ncbi:hypothetical protein, partial [Mesorhizobium sp. M3A.F.Ca.ET.174.01.1.1]|uniref:hypothetical protein n=1 Tax=Mesorhizobium sp. M3A.F.Ca.ET.174.01.1.1 TaxID=2563944 RepID=UPI001AED433A